MADNIEKIDEKTEETAEEHAEETPKNNDNEIYKFNNHFKSISTLSYTVHKATWPNHGLHLDLVYTWACQSKLGQGMTQGNRSYTNSDFLGALFPSYVKPNPHNINGC